MPKGIYPIEKRKGLFIKGHIPHSGCFKKNNIPWSKGKKGIHSKEGKRRIAEAVRKRMLENNPLKGKQRPTFSKKWRDNMSKSHKGKRSNAWKGGITILNKVIRTLPKYIQWRSTIFARDSWTCQTCHKRGTYLEVHHIIRLSDIIQKYQIKASIQAIKCKEIWDMNNGVTLCKDCHNLTKGRIKCQK